MLTYNINVTMKSKLRMVLEQIMRIELTLPDWKSGVLPLYDICIVAVMPHSIFVFLRFEILGTKPLVGEVGVEPTVFLTCPIYSRVQSPLCYSPIFGDGCESRTRVFALKGRGLNRLPNPPKGLTTYEAYKT